jgi:hypothetical protein
MEMVASVAGRLSRGCPTVAEILKILAYFS